VLDEHCHDVVEYGRFFLVGHRWFLLGVVRHFQETFDGPPFQITPPVRALRPAVIWRKLSFGTQSAEGSRFVETLLSVIATCRQQNRDPVAYLTDAIDARFRGEKAPLLRHGV
jgi:hypothetical protein